MKTIAAVMAVVVLGASFAAARELVIKDTVTGKSTAWVKQDRSPAVAPMPAGEVGLTVNVPRLVERWQKAQEPKLEKFYHEEIGGLQAGALYADASGGLTDSKIKTSGEGMREVKPGVMATLGASISEKPWWWTIGTAAVVGGVTISAQNNWWGLFGSNGDSAAGGGGAPATVTINGNNNQVQVVSVGGTGNNANPRLTGPSTSSTTTTPAQ